MGNSRTRTINYKPKMSSLEAYDLLDPRVRAFLQTTLTQWDCYAILRFQRKNTVWQTLQWLEAAEREELKRPWWRGMPSPTFALGLKPIKPNYAAA